MSDATLDDRASTEIEAPSWTSAFLSTLRTEGFVVDACRAANIPRSAANRLRKQDEVFAREWDDAMEDWNDQLEKTAVRVALGQHIDKNGNQLPHIHVGLLQFLLKGRRPEIYNTRPRRIERRVDQMLTIEHDPDPPRIERGRAE